MAVEIQTRRGTELEHETFTGAAGELTVVTDKAGLRIHNGIKAGGDKVQMASTSNIVNLLDFNPAADGVTDDTGVIKAAVLAAAGKTLYIPEGIYHYYNSFSRDAILVDNITILNRGTFITPRGFRLSGNNIYVQGGKYGRNNKSTNANTNYEAGLAVSGDWNQVGGTECYHVDGAGLTFSGRFGTVQGNYLHDNQVGLLMGATCSHVLVEHNECANNNVNNNSGADGMNIQRNTDNITVRNNKIYGSGEHGVYFQGFSSRFENNEVHDNHSSGLKFGTHPTGQATKPLQLPVTGDLGAGTIQQQGGNAVVISGNSCYNNGGDHIYLQPAFKHVEICNNTCWSDDISVGSYGIKLTYFSGAGETDELEELRDIKVYGNSLIDCSMFSECNGSQIYNNYVEGQIYLYASDGGKTGQPDNLNWHTVTDNVVRYMSDGTLGSIYQGRNDYPTTIKNNDLMSFVTGGGNADSQILEGNIIREQKASIDFTRMKNFDRNTVYLVGDIPLNSGTVGFGFSDSFRGNEIHAPDRVSNTVVTASFNSTSSQNGVFADNIINAPQTARVVSIWGDNVSCTGNTIVNSGAYDLIIDYYSSGGVFTGNTANTGSINIREDGKNVVVGNGMRCTNTDPTNVIMGNLP